MNIRRLTVLGALALIVSLTPLAAQRGAPPQPQNLKVLPQDIEPQQLMGMMRNVSQALGVRCNHCHIPQQFHLDEKPEKEVARAMIKMVQNVKGNADEFLPDGRADKLTCWTCHRGSTTIEMPEPPQGGPGGKRGKKAQ